MTLKNLIFLAIFNILGVFVGNWLSGPYIIEGRTFFQSFIVGLIAAVISVLLWLIIIGIFYLRKR
jgi:hypothetical protein